MILSNLPNLTGEDAREFLHRFYAAYPGLKIWQQMVSDGARLTAIGRETYKKRAREASKLLKGVMEQAGNEMLKVIPCETDAKMGKDWSFKDESRFGLGTIFSKAISMIRR